MANIQRSAMGRSVDMNAIVTKNEKVRAVGNMNVNARGDILNSNNEVIQDNNRRIKETYSRTVAQETPKRPPGTIPFSNLTSAERELEEDIDDEDIKK